MPKNRSTVGLNPYQAAVAKSYECGEFAHLVDESFKTAAEMKSAIQGVGDGLFIFLMRELSTAEDCENLEDAVRRMSTIADQVNTAKLAIERLADETGPKAG